MSPIIVRICAVFATLAGIAFLIFLYHENPNNPDTILPDCIFQKLTSLSCPGCGMTRAAYAILHLDFKDAFTKNALAFFLCPCVITLIFFPKLANVKFFPHIVLFVILGFWILRNIFGF